MRKTSVLFLYCLTFCWQCSPVELEGDAGAKMQELVIDLANYARTKKNNFIIIPQNGVELCFVQQDPSAGIHPSYVQTIDGVGIEELFYDGSKKTVAERLEMLQMLPGKPVLVSEYVHNTLDNTTARLKNQQYQFIPFIRSQINYDYTEIPPLALNEENTQDILQLQQVTNYLYLISSERFATKKTYLDALRATNYDLLILDLFFGEETLSAVEVQSLKFKANGAQRLIIAYQSIGSAERFRYYWQSSWKINHPSWIKKKYTGYPDEYWVEFWHPQWQEIMYGNPDAYLDRIMQAGFDGVYLDNVEAYYFLYH